jgi:hypothetical protein
MGYCCRIFTPVQPERPAASRGIFSLVLSGPLAQPALVDENYDPALLLGLFSPSR